MSRPFPMLASAVATAILGSAACANEHQPTPAVDAPPSSAMESRAALPPSSGLEMRTIPTQDPGPPFYARVGMQFLEDGEWLAIPFYRDPACVPEDFNLLEFFHFPGADGPGAFACPLLMTGRLLTEPDASPETFPRQVLLEGDAVPFWIVSWEAFQAAAAEGEVTVGDLAALSPLRGIASRFHETLHPREGEHRIILDASGLLEDGRPFRFHATDIEDELRAIRIEFR
jgi:hypothetical protein